MTLQTIGGALAELKAVLSLMAPAGAPALQGVWVYPDEYAAVSLDALPVVLVSEAVVVTSAITREAQRRTLLHKWPALVQIFLAEGTLTDDASAAAVAHYHRGWIAELARVVVGHSTLNGAAHGVGIKIPGQLLTYRVGQMPWWKSRMFWGVNATLDVYQMMRFETEA